MHMADALVNSAVAATMYGASAIAAGISIKKLHDENDSKKAPLMGIMGAFIFATQMINFTIPGTGSSGHLCGGMLASAILGPYAGFLTMIGVLLIQGLFFADGGLLALGCNIWNMAFYGCFLGSFLFWKPLAGKKINPGKIFAACILGCMFTLQLGAFSVVLETLISGITELPFKFFITAMQPIHLAIGCIEGLITSAVLCFVYNARPELFWGTSTENNGKMSYKATLITLGVCAIIIGGALSLFASSNPDGLEWSIEKITGSAELETAGQIYENASNIQEATSILPDYAFKNSETSFGTTFSGIVGALIIFGLCIGIGTVVKIIQKAKLKKKLTNNA